MVRFTMSSAIVLYAVSIMGLAQDQKIYFAQFGNGVVGDIKLESDIVLPNPSETETASGTVDFFQADGSPFASDVEGEGITSSVAFEVPPLDSITISTTGQGALETGTAVVSSDHLLSGVIRFEISAPAGSGIGSGIAGVPASQPLKGFITPVRRVAGGINTGVAIRNIGAEEVNLTLSLREGGLEVPSGSVSETIPGNGQLVAFINQFSPGVFVDPPEGPESFVGSLVVTSDGIIAATALEQGTLPGQFTTLPVAPLVEGVSFEDANLEACIRSALNIPEAMLNTLDAQILSTLECDGSDFQPDRIVSVAGLEAFTNLRKLVLRDNVFITDISPLAGLTESIELDLERNSISDISPLAGLTGLHSLNLEENSIDDITLVAGFTQLTELRLSANMISNINPVAGLTQLTSLGLADNSVADITPVEGLTQLTDLELNDNSISDITPVAGLAQLQSLRLKGNMIGDLTPVAGLTQLGSLELDNNSINSLTPLVDNADFGPGFIGLSGNPLDVDDCPDLQTLISRGSFVSHDVSCMP